MFFPKRRLLAKIEDTYGTDSNPDGSNVILTRNLNISEPYGGEEVQRNLDRETLGRDESIKVDPQVQMSFEVELAGSGALGVAPAFGPLLRAVGFRETINAGVDVQYELVSELFESLTLYYFMDKNLHRCPGGRGNIDLEFPRRGWPFLRFNFWAGYTRPVAATPVTPNASAFKRPVPVNKSNTTLSLGGYAPPAESLTLALNNEVVNRNIINRDERLIVDRAPGGQVVIEMPEVNDKDVFADWIESHNVVNTVPLALTHGVTAGNIVELTAPQLQLSNLRPSESDGVAVATLDTAYIPTDAGDDEFKLTFK